MGHCLGSWDKAVNSLHSQASPLGREVEKLSRLNISGLKCLGEKVLQVSVFFRFVILANIYKISWESDTSLNMKFMLFYIYILA
jgi:hypothetical protein